MHKEGEEIHVDTAEASAGETSGHMRWVLGTGLLLAIVVLSLIWITGALTQPGEVDPGYHDQATTTADGDSGATVDEAATEVPAEPLE